MQKYIEINWLQDVDIIQCNALSSYISNTNDVMKSLSLVPIFISLLYKIISENTSFIKNLKLQNDKISVSIVKKLY